MKRGIFWMAVVGLLVGCGQDPPPPRQVEAGAVARPVQPPASRPTQAARDEGFLGVILPRQSVDVASEIPGRLEWVHVREGDPVRRGQALATLNRAELRQELEMAQASLRAEEAEVARRKVDLEQAENLLTRRLAIPESFPKEQIRQAELQKQAAQADLDAARARGAEQRARMAQVQGKLARAEVRSPADGTVSRRYLEAGAMAGPGEPIVRLISAGDLIVRFAVPPEQARTLVSAQPVVVQADGAELRATIEQVSPEVDPPSGMVLLVAKLEEKAMVKPGSVVRVRRTT